MSKKIDVNDMEESIELTEDAASQIKGGARLKFGDVTLKRGTLNSSSDATAVKWKGFSLDGKSVDINIETLD